MKSIFKYSPNNGFPDHCEICGTRTRPLTTDKSNQHWVCDKCLPFGSESKKSTTINPIDDPVKKYAYDLWQLEEHCTSLILKELICRQYSERKSKIPSESVAIYRQLFPHKRLIFILWNRNEIAPKEGDLLKDHRCQFGLPPNSTAEKMDHRIRELKEKKERLILIASKYDASEVVRQDNAWGHLTDRNMKIFDDLFHEKLSLRKIALKYKLSATRIQQYRTKYLARINLLEIKSER